MGFLFNEESDLLDTEGVMGGVGTILAVFTSAKGGEEGDQCEITDGDISCGSSLGGGVQGLDSAGREGPNSCWRRILFLVGRQMASQPKFKLPHAVVLRVVGPYGCEYLTE